MTDRAELRRLAEAAIAAQDNIVGPYNDETAVAWGKALQAYTKAANPAAIIELLDMIEAMQCCGNCRYFSIGYMGDYCVTQNGHGEKPTTRRARCEHWTAMP